jgi:hypothetical protein
MEFINSLPEIKIIDLSVCAECHNSINNHIDVVERVDLEGRVIEIRHFLCVFKKEAEP